MDARPPAQPPSSHRHHDHSKSSDQRRSESPASPAAEAAAKAAATERREAQPNILGDMMKTVKDKNFLRNVVGIKIGLGGSSKTSPSDRKTSTVEGRTSNTSTQQQSGRRIPVQSTQLSERKICLSNAPPPAKESGTSVENKKQ